MFRETFGIREGPWNWAHDDASFLELLRELFRRQD
jgi:hypothetical protein